MRKQMMENAALEVAAQIRTVEECIDSAIAELADLQGKMVRARAVTGVGFATSHPAFEQLAATTSGLIAARGGVANCHTALVETRRVIPGLRTTAFGEGDECPPPSGFVDLRVVA